MNVSSEQMKSLERGEAVSVTLEHTECVIIRKDVYEKIEKLIDYSEPPLEETYPAVLEGWDVTGSPDDATDYS